MTSHHSSAGARPVELSIERWIGTVLVAVMGLVHLYLWLQGYHEVAIIGPLFLLNVIGSGLLVIALIASPPRLLRLFAALAALFTLGTLLALVLSITVTLFGFREDPHGVLVVTSLAVEAVGTLVLARLSLGAR